MATIFDPCQAGDNYRLASNITVKRHNIASCITNIVCSNSAIFNYVEQSPVPRKTYLLPKKPITTIIGRRQDKHQTYDNQYNSPTCIAENNSRRAINHRVLRSLRRLNHPKSYDIPTILSSNVRSLAKKVDEIQQIAEFNSAGIICITESWLSPEIPDASVSIPGYNLFRNDRTGTSGGGVCVYLDHKVPCKLLKSCDQVEVESIWISMRPHSLPRGITSIVLGVIYHSTSNKEPENIILREHIHKNLDTLLSNQPNALVIVTGDFNPSSTGLKVKDITQVNHLKQLVTFKTRDSGTLDWFLTNRPKIFTVSQLPKIGSSDHYAILAKPIIERVTKSVNNKIKIRDMRDSAWRALGRWITQNDWTSILSAITCEDKFTLFMADVNQAIDTFLPQRVVKKHTTDRPWITSKVKLWIRKRQIAFTQQGKHSITYRLWRNKVQCGIREAKYNYYQNKVVEVEKTNPAKWWREIKKLTGQDVKQEWHHQFLDNGMNIKSLANEINNFFVGLTDHFPPLLPQTLPIDVPHDLLVTENEVFRALSSLQISKAVGPDNIPNRLLKEFAPELAPIIQDIYNQSMREGYIPSLLKSSIVTPIPKLTPPKSIENDLRPISLTCTVAKIMEGFTCTRLLPQLEEKLDPRQYARKGHSTTDALLYMLQAVYEAMDSGESGARIFFADFSKGFDLIDHTILIQELDKLNVHPALMSWIAAFLTNRKQAVRIGGVLSDWQILKGGVPQGTKLGVVLFIVMTNNLLSEWNLRTKFVDDTTALEIIPRNSISLLNYAASDIYNFAMDHNMKLNPLKCKEMLINFLRNPYFLIHPIEIGNIVIERVKKYKILGVIMTSDLKWNNHVEYIVKKASKKLYSLRILRRAGVNQSNMLKVYLSTVRPVLEYAVPVWQGIPDYLSDAIEVVQKRALKIIYPENESYSMVLTLLQLPTLKTRRELLCVKYMNKMKCKDHPLFNLLPKPVVCNYNFNLRKSSEQFYLFNDTIACRTKRAQSFFTFKYFNYID